MSAQITLDVRDQKLVCMERIMLKLIKFAPLKDHNELSDQEYIKEYRILHLVVSQSLSCSRRDQ